VLDYHRIRGARHIQQLLGRKIVYGMRCHQQRQIVDVQAFCGQSAVLQECRRYDGNRWNSALLKVGRVVDTPRRAAPSITPGVHDRMHFSVEFVGD
jgi:hypothetical protein